MPAHPTRTSARSTKKVLAPTKKPSVAKKPQRAGKATPDVVPGVPPGRVVRPPPPAQPSPSALRAEAEHTLDARREAARGKAPVTTLRSPGGLVVEACRLAKPRPHWLLVTRGLLQHGHELAVRAAVVPEEATPPAWPLRLLDEVAQARAQGATLGAGQLVPLPAQAVPELGTSFRALALGVDPSLGEVLAGSARFGVLAVVPLDRDEERVVREWSPLGLLEVLAKVDPLWLLDAERTSLLASPRARTAIESRAEREGSAMEAAWVHGSRWVAQGPSVTWTLSLDGVEALVSLLKGRTAHQRPFHLRSAEALVEVRPADAPRLEPTGDRLRLHLTQPAARALRSQLRATPGTSRLEAVPGLTISVA